MTPHTSPYFRQLLRLFLAVLLIHSLWFTTQSPPAHAANQIWYVNHAASGNNTGSSWQHAFTDLQAALSAAQVNDQIWVAKGIYYPTSDPSERDVSFAPKVGVALYGGFAGTESQLSQRDWQANPTILSGDIDRNDTHTNGIVVNTSGLQGNNSYHVLWGNNLNSTNHIDGFIITAGQANGTDQHALGGGMYNYYRSSPSINNVRFSGNYAQWGGALANNDESLPMLTNVSFSGNYAYTLGGAMYNTQNSRPYITKSSFVGNAAKDGGGAIHSGQNSEPMITYSSFSNNTADWGGAISNSNSTALMINVSFKGNSAQNQGGAFYNAASTLTIKGVLFSGNKATSGGAIYNVSNGTFTIDNASFVGNAAIQQGGAIYNTSNKTVAIFNSIVWGNNPALQLSTESTLTFTSSLVENCTPNTNWPSSCGKDGGNNISPANPLFVEAVSHTSAPTTGGDLRLKRGSPAIDAGKNRAGTEAVDLADNTRIINSIIDLGAYEAQHYLDLSIVGKGTLTYTPQLSEYPMYSSVTIKATAMPGWSFQSWDGDLSGHSAEISLSMDSHKKATVTFRNDPPIAKPGANRSVSIGSPVTLDGRASFDADPTQTVTYAWVQTGGTHVTLTGANSAQPTFTAPSVAGTLTFMLIVTDNLGQDSTPVNVTITVTATATQPSYRVFLPLTLR